MQGLHVLLVATAFVLLHTAGARHLKRRQQDAMSLLGFDPIKIWCGRFKDNPKPIDKKTDPKFNCKRCVEACALKAQGKEGDEFESLMEACRSGGNKNCGIAFGPPAEEGAPAVTIGTAPDVLVAGPADSFCRNWCEGKERGCEGAEPPPTPPKKAEDCPTCMTKVQMAQCAKCVKIEIDDAKNKYATKCRAIDADPDENPDAEKDEAEKKGLEEAKKEPETDDIPKPSRYFCRIWCIGSEDGKTCKAKTEDMSPRQQKKCTKCVDVKEKGVCSTTCRAEDFANVDDCKL